MRDRWTREAYTLADLVIVAAIAVALSSFITTLFT